MSKINDHHLSLAETQEQTLKSDGSERAVLEASRGGTQNE